MRLAQGLRDRPRIYGSYTLRNLLVGNSLQYQVHLIYGLIQGYLDRGHLSRVGELVQKYEYLLGLTFRGTRPGLGEIPVIFEVAYGVVTYPGYVPFCLIRKCLRTLPEGVLLGAPRGRVGLMVDFLVGREFLGTARELSLFVGNWNPQPLEFLEAEGPNLVVSFLETGNRDQAQALAQLIPQAAPRIAAKVLKYQAQLGTSLVSAFLH